MSLNIVYRSLGGALVAAAVAVPALAGAATPEPEIGRFEMFSGSATLDGKETQTVLMLDTASGRVWMLEKSTDRGVHMKRLLMERLEKTPEGMLNRPLPLTVKPTK